MKTATKINAWKKVCKICGMDYEKIAYESFRKQLEILDPETRRALERAVKDAKETER